MDKDKTILLIVGQPGAGKSTACEYLAKNYGFSVILISDLIRGYAILKGISLANRQDYIDAHTAMLGEQGKYIITDTILRSPFPRICVDGIRVPAHIMRLKDLGAKVLALYCPPNVRFARTIKRSGPLDKASFEAFILDEIQEATNSDPFVQNTHRALSMADYRIDTLLTFDRVCKRLDNLIPMQ